MTVMPVGEIMLMTLMVHPNVLRAWALGEHEEKPFMVLSVLTSVLSNDLPKSADEVTALDRSLPTCPSTRQLLHGLSPIRWPEPNQVTFWKRNADVKKWPLTRALNYGVQLARAIKYCHDVRLAILRPMMCDPLFSGIWVSLLLLVLAPRVGWSRVLHVCRMPFPATVSSTATSNVREQDSYPPPPLPASIDGFRCERPSPSVIDPSWMGAS